MSHMMSHIFSDNDGLILMRVGSVMVIALVDSLSGLHQVNIHTGTGSSFSINTTGVLRSGQLNDGSSFLFDQKIQFILNDGLKFEVPFCSPFRINMCINTYCVNTLTLECSH